MNREHPPFYLDRYRKGSDYWRAHHEPKLVRDPLELPGNDTWELDGSKFNFFGVRRGRKVRFTYALVVDVGTRMIVGHAVGMSESTEVVVLALRRAVLRYGAPKTLRTDLGKANRGEAMGDANRRRAGVDRAELTGIAADMQCEAQWCTGRSGWQKPSVESAVNVVGSGFDPLHRSHLGNNHKNRVQGIDKWADVHIDELPDAASIDRLFGEWIEARNKLLRADMERLSPAQKFARTAIPKRVVHESVLNVRLLRA